MSTLAHYRSMLTEHFRAKAREHGLAIDPRTDGRFDLTHHLYEEDHAGREIIIQYADPPRLIELDYFFKDTERYDADVELLYITVVQPEQALAVLWSMYRMWMHENRSRAEIEAAYPIIRPDIGDREEDEDNAR